MAQRAMREREARLGRPRGAVGTAPHAVVLVLPGGGPGGRRGATAAAAAVPLARRLARAARDEPLVAHVVRYRSAATDTAPSEGPPEDPAEALAHDAEWAVGEAVRRYGDVPVCLAGADIGGRAALRAAGHEAVSSVIALGPMLEDDGDPVRQLLGRHVLIVHGTDDARCDPELSFRFAERAKKVNADVCRFEVHTAGHGLRQHSFEVAALAQDFVLGTLCGRDLCRPLTDALAAPPPLGLRMPLAAGFGRTLRS
ncbi:alpha/beta hydrolase [Streptomyces sp. NHF165]|uniref:alpha/beta hydrolase n=1 Tax=Streptomyces TaxID=1883 RepID=UPI00132E918F|nr:MULTISPECIES: alpha/beta hydrolase [Streptomyces]QHF97276.1 alpha/beta hydrolase [Streptomyces sp. NHF165]